MLPELGHLALILTWCLTLAMPLVALISWRVPGLIGNTRLSQLLSQSSLMAFIIVALAFGILMHAYVTSDFSVLNVAVNSHASKPLIYRISGTWGNHEGSMLLWALVLAGCSAAFARTKHSLSQSVRQYVLLSQAVILCCIVSFILFTSNPFERVVPAPSEGQGLNPLLQHPALALHPPMLYIGYVGFSLAFSFGIAALLSGSAGREWARALRLWSLAAWSFLTLGIALGSWWAYHELGWGGYWFWDPVENASLMPWLAATALIHSLFIAEKSQAMTRWCVFLALLTFGLSLMGTFLVRSGVLTSVHAFANDPDRGMFILTFTVLLMGGAFLLYALRMPTLHAKDSFAPLSLESGLLVNNLLLLVLCGTVMLGTLYPLLLQLLTDREIAVGPPYFSATFSPLSVLLLLVVSFAPYLNWQRGSLTQLRRAFTPWLAGVVAAGSIAWWYDSQLPEVVRSIWAVLCMMVAGGVASSTIMLYLRRGQLLNGHWQERWQRIPASLHGMGLAHLGLAVLLAGFAGSTFWRMDVAQRIQPGNVMSLGQWQVTLNSLDNLQGPNYVAVQAELLVHDKHQHEVIRLYPEQRFYPVERTGTSETGLYSTLWGDLYTVIGQDPLNKEQIQLHVRYKPLIQWIWLGSALLVVGGMMSVSSRLMRRRRHH